MWIIIRVECNNDNGFGLKSGQNAFNAKCKTTDLHLKVSYNKRCKALIGLNTLYITIANQKLKILTKIDR